MSRMTRRTWREVLIHRGARPGDADPRAVDRPVDLADDGRLLLFPSHGNRRIRDLGSRSAGLSRPHRRGEGRVPGGRAEHARSRIRTSPWCRRPRAIRAPVDAARARRRLGRPEGLHPRRARSGAHVRTSRGDLNRRYDQLLVARAVYMVLADMLATSIQESRASPEAFEVLAVVPRHVTLQVTAPVGARPRRAATRRPSPARWSYSRCWCC